MSPVGATRRVRPRHSLGSAAVALAVSLALITAGCGDDSDSSSAGTSTVGIPLEGTTWFLTTGGGMGVDLVPAAVTGRFEAGTMSGNTGCNEYTAPYKLDGQSLTIGPEIASTQKACGEQETKVEAAYLALLPQVASFYITLNALTLSNADLMAMLIYHSR